MVIHELLKTYFGYDAFRPLQEKIIAHVLTGQDALVLMPTGGGKSLCFQLPALAMDGVTLVVSPLIALMKDQVDALRANGIEAAFINSTLTPDEIEQVQKRVKRGEVKLLYVAPERLALGQFREFLRTIKVALIAIDEAHCISEWGNDFRPDYRNLKLLRQDFPGISMIALTATATERVREDIISELSLEKGRLFLSSFNRSNLTYTVRGKRGAFGQLLSLLQHYKGKPAIIYCFSRKDAEHLAADLRQEGFSALPYHAGLTPSVRTTTQEKFIHDEISIIVATIAFGMGIDKPDIRLIVHFHLPKSIEGYYQETGRAGRDGLQSECVMFYSYGDTMKHQFFIREIQDPTERQRARQKLQQVIDYCEQTLCRRKFLLNYFNEEWNEKNCEACDICIAPQEQGQEMMDATEITQKILSAVLRTGQRFGIGHISEVLQGKRRKKILQQGHEQLSVFGIAKEYGNDELKRIINLLVAQGLLSKDGDRYPVLSVTLQGKKFLKERRTINLPQVKTPADEHYAKQSGELAYDELLFEKLRALRKELALKQGVPPFIIFGDRTLQEMAYYMPKSKQELSRIFGVGAQKLEQFGDVFLSAMQEYVKDNRSRVPLGSASKSSTARYQETKDLLLQKYSLQDIAKQRKLTVGTIISHIERLTANGCQLDLDYLKPPEDKLAQIKTAVDQAGGFTFLTPVRQILGEQFSYDELRIARLFWSPPRAGVIAKQSSTELT